MTEREALKLALEALENVYGKGKRCKAAITAIKQALAQPEQHQDWCASLTQMLASMPPKQAPCNCKPAQPEQEPVAVRLSNGVIDVLGGAIVPIGALLYTTPPQPEHGTSAVVRDDGNICYQYTTPPQPEPVIDKSAAVRIATSLGWEPKRKPLTSKQIREWWASENGFEDCDMTKLDDFTQVVRGVEGKHGIKE